MNHPPVEIVSYSEEELTAMMADLESDAVASAQDERILSEKRRHRDPHFDARRAPAARLADLSLRRFEEEYLPSVVDAETLASNDRSMEERLAAAKMIVSVDDPVPTVGGASSSSASDRRTFFPARTRSSCGSRVRSSATRSRTRRCARA